MLHLNRHPAIVGVPEHVNKVYLKAVKANKIQRGDEWLSVNTDTRGWKRRSFDRSGL